MAQIYLMEGGEQATLLRALSRLLPPWITATSFPPRERMTEMLAILPERAGLPEKNPFPPGTTVIVSAEEREQLFRLSGCPVKVITCGFCGKNTVTFSSRRENQGVVSLLRSFEGASGMVEPMDIPVSIPHGCSDYAVLAAAAVCLFFAGHPKKFPAISAYDFPVPEQAIHADAKSG